MTTITVTAEHIAEGVRDSCELCPVALAVAEAIPELEGIGVDASEISFMRSAAEGWITVIPPSEVAKFIRDFDHGGTDAVNPFSFDLDYPEVAA